jgi:divalent metal cation (Fe/Co/Zn/Cd) transporter
MSEETQTWIKHSFFLSALTGFVHVLQAVAGVALWSMSSSPVLLAFGLDALICAFRETILTQRIGRHGGPDTPGAGEALFFRVAGGAYVTLGLGSFVLGGGILWLGQRAVPSLLGIGLAAVSMLMIPIIGSYMKALAMELHSPELKAAAVFTFGNSYLSLVLLISLLVNSRMDLWWGDGLGAIIMSPFILQKGIQILVGRPTSKFTEE